MVRWSGFADLEFFDSSRSYEGRSWPRRTSTSLLIDPDDKVAASTGGVGQVVNAGSRAPRRIQQKRAV